MSWNYSFPGESNLTVVFELLDEAVYILLLDKSEDITHPLVTIAGADSGIIDDKRGLVLLFSHTGGRGAPVFRNRLLADLDEVEFVDLGRCFWPAAEVVVEVLEVFEKFLLLLAEFFEVEIVLLLRTLQDFLGLVIAELCAEDEAGGRHSESLLPRLGWRREDGLLGGGLGVLGSRDLLLSGASFFRLLAVLALALRAYLDRGIVDLGSDLLFIETLRLDTEKGFFGHFLG